MIKKTYNFGQFLALDDTQIKDTLDSMKHLSLDELLNLTLAGVEYITEQTNAAFANANHTRKAIEEDRKKTIKRLREFSEDKARFAADVLQNDWFFGECQEELPNQLYVSDVLGQLMEANLVNQKKFNIQDFMSYEGYARNHRTVSVNFGRQTGKTTAIKKLCGYGDVVFAHNAGWKKELARFLPTDRDLSIFTFNDTQQCSFTLGKKNKFRVWIDEASLFKQEEIDAIYAMLASRTTQFILLG